MAKEKKPRAEQYEEKLSFEGSLDDLVHRSVKHANKLKIGDIIKEDGKKVTVIATRESEDFDIPEGFNYVVEDSETKKKFFIK